MDQWMRELDADLDRLRAGDLLRSLVETESAGPLLRRRGRELVNLASNDYLGLSQHPALRAAAIAAIEAHGSGAGASRLVSGHHPLHAQVEERLARFKHAPAALLCPTGFVANLAVITALAGPGDLVCVDKLNHASLLDAARASGAVVRTFPHLNYDKLRRLLERWRSRGVASADGDQTAQIETGVDQSDESAQSYLSAHRSLPARPPRALIVTDSVFSMDGDVADLPVLCDLADQYDAILIVDEAHGTGVLGATGAGLCELQGVTERVDVVVSTASKALGSLGGLVTGPRAVIDTLINRARSFIYTTAIPPAQAAAIGAALDVIAAEPWRRERVLAMSQTLRTRLHERGWLPRLDGTSGDIAIAGAPGTAATAIVTPIIPLVVGSERRALSLSEHLESQGLFAPAIRPPTVAPGAARVRLSLRADLPDAIPDRIMAALASWQDSNDCSGCH
jgi:8-amino-7-oxononanoate synthase